MVILSPTVAHARARAPAVDRERVAVLVRELLLAIGDDPDRSGLRQSPERVALNWAEALAGAGEDPHAALERAIDVGASGADAPATSGVVLMRDIRFRSLCEQNLLPFAGRAHLAYLPDDHVVGFGSLVRVVDVLAGRLQTQERLGEEIAATIASTLLPRALLVVLDAEHHCVAPESASGRPLRTRTIAARGAYCEPSARAEILALIGPDGGHV